MNCEMAARTAGADHSFAGKVRVGIDRATLYAAVAAAPAALGMKMVPMKNRSPRCFVCSRHRRCATHTHSHVLHAQKERERERGAERHFKTMVLNGRCRLDAKSRDWREQPTFISIAVASMGMAVSQKDLGMGEESNPRWQRERNSWL